MAKRKAVPDELRIPGIPESDLYSRLVSMERQADAMIQRKKVDILAALRAPAHSKRVVRVWVYTMAAAGQPPAPDRIHVGAPETAPTAALYAAEAGARAGGLAPPDVVMAPAEGAEGGGMAAAGGAAEAGADAAWSLNIYGEVLPGEEAPGAQGEAEEAVLSSVLKKVEVAFGGEGCPKALDGRTMAWEAGAHEGPPQKAFRVHAPGKPGGVARIQLHPAYQPQRYLVPHELALVLGTPVDTKTRIIERLWKYIKEKQLQDPSKPGTIVCNDMLRGVFKMPQFEFAALDALLDATLMAPPPAVITYPLDPESPSPSKPQCMEIEVDIPDLRERTQLEGLLKKVDVSNRVQALDQRLAGLIEQVERKKKRRAFFLAFSHSPVDFIRSVLDSQQRELEVMSTAMGGSYAQLVDKDEVFQQDWVHDSVCKYLQRRLATGAQ